MCVVFVRHLIATLRQVSFKSISLIRYERRNEAHIRLSVRPFPPFICLSVCASFCLTVSQAECDTVGSSMQYRTTPEIVFSRRGSLEPNKKYPFSMDYKLYSLNILEIAFPFLSYHIHNNHIYIHPILFF